MYPEFCSISQRSLFISASSSTTNIFIELFMAITFLKIIFAGHVNYKSIVYMRKNLITYIEFLDK
jgi:hypothetical protein